ncbi:MAG: Primosomal protein, partial [Dehalococcoidales bacterium]|nr:Primosomal protein [Dehalococcoidales bacterium]
MRYAEVCVNSPLGLRQTFSYSVPPGLNSEVGQAVWVPFGQKLLQGIVVELTAQPAVEETKEIAGVIASVPVLSHDRLELARWISEHYLSPLFDAVALLLPPGFEQKTRTFVTTAGIPDDAALSSLSEEQRHALELVTEAGKISLTKLEKALGKKKAQAVVTQLVRRGLVLRSYEIEPTRARPRVEPYLSLAVDTDQARQEAAKLRGEGASKQASLLDVLVQEHQPIPWAEARKKVNVTKAVADALSKQGLVKIELIEVRRDPLSHQEIAPSPPPTLTSAQESALSAIRANLRESATGHLPPAIFLLHGVTGSGKTEVYLQALAEAVRLGKRGIVLVPEIALTPQTIERFASRFPRKVAVLHSQLSLGEQFDEWRRISRGQADVVIGPRSALFAPQPDLGLIVIDEEHEWSYKQSDKSPRYHARDVAIKLAELSGAVVILGSATPDV